MNAPPIVSDEGRLAALARYDILDSAPEQGFDDVVQLASDICAAPVALVSLVAGDRQWFKARVGLETRETDLGSSVCAHALREPDLLVIPDLTQDPRTVGNPFVTGPSAIRFYAGAPLRTADGHVLGSLCVIDTAPRPEGLSPQQARGLRNLAGQVMSLLELRRSVAERDELIAERRGSAERLLASEGRLSAREALWRNLFERLSEGFVVGEVIRDEEGRIVDWRFVDANAAWGELIGVEPAAVIGRRVREVFPGIEEARVLDVARVVETGEPVMYTRRVVTDERWYEARAYPLERGRFAVTFLEITERVAAEGRRSALLTLGDRLRDLSTIAAMTRAAAEIVGEALDVSRAGFGRLVDDDEVVEIEADWTAEGLGSVAGRHRFDTYGTLRDELVAGHSLVVEDVMADRRTAADPTGLRGLDIRAMVNVPVREHGRTVAIFFVHQRVPRRWTPETLAFLRNVADRVAVGVSRLRAEADQRVLNQELSHRLKNTLAMVQAIGTQTLKGVTERDAVDAFAKRIFALSTAHDVLLQQDWSSASLRTVVEAVLANFDRPETFVVSGPDLSIGPRATMSASLLLHELATNAVKYGSLSEPGGRVDVSWRREEEGGESNLVFIWTERGGPPVIPPTRNGFGSRLIRMGLVGTGGVQLRYDPLGFEAEMRASMDQVGQS